MNIYSSNWNIPYKSSDCHSWWISKVQSGREKEQDAIKFCFKLGKNATETYGMLHTASHCLHESSISFSLAFKEGRESVRDDERCGKSKGVNTPELIGQRVWVRVTMMRFLREFKKRFRQWHFHEDNAPAHNSILATGLFDQDGHRDSSSSSL